MNSSESFIPKSVESNQEQIYQVPSTNCQNCKIWKIIALASIFAVIPSSTPPPSQSTRAVPADKVFRIKWNVHQPGQPQTYINKGFLILKNTVVETYKEDAMPLKRSFVDQKTVDNILAKNKILFAEEVDIDITDETDGMYTNNIITPPTTTQKTNTASSAFDNSINKYYDDSPNDKEIMSAEATPLNVASLSVEERQSSSISAIISSIERAVEDFYYDEEYAHPLKNHVVGLDEDRTVIFVKADIDSGCLKNGKDPEKISHTLAVQYGVPADSVYQLIGKKIGGHGKPSNVFPVNPNVLHDWKSDEDVVYSHVQKVNCYASLTFAFKYGDENEPLRPSDIYYRIQLFENGKSIDNAIERHIKNTLVPPKTFHLTFADYSKNNV